MTLGTALREALARVRRRPLLAALPYLAGLLLSQVFLLPLLFQLQTVLARRPAAAAIERGEATALWTEVFADNPTIGVALFGGGLLALAAAWLLGAGLTGALLAGLRRPGDPRRGVGLAAAGADGFWPVLKVTALGSLLRLPVLVAGGAALGIGGSPRRHELSQEIPWVVFLSLGLGFLWAYGSVVLHLAEARVVLGQTTAWRALLFGLRAANRVRRSSAGLAVVSLLGYGILIMLALALQSHRALSLSLLGALLPRQLIAVARAVLSVTVLGAALRLAEASPDYPRVGGPEADDLLKS